MICLCCRQIPICAGESMGNFVLNAMDEWLLIQLLLARRPATLTKGFRDFPEFFLRNSGMIHEIRPPLFSFASYLINF
jgi:hypothetical protein